MMTVSQGTAVEREDFPFALHSLIQHAQLPAADGGQDVAQAIVVADLRVLTPREPLAGDAMRVV
ncbi:MAG: hypothetical protein WAW26_24340, partial [Anaerolineae bacterium]